MALIPEPSWLNPSRFIDASQAGAALGLGRARMLTDANEAAGRLGLGYAQLGQQAGEAAMRLAAAREEAAARMAQAGAENERQAAFQNAGLALRERGQAFDEQQAAAKALLPEPLKTAHIGDSLIQVNPDGSIKKLFDATSSKLPPLVKEQYNAAQRAKQSAAQALQDPLKSAMGGENLANIIKASEDVIVRIESQYLPQSTNAPALNPVLPQQGTNVLNPADPLGILGP